MITVICFLGFSKKETGEIPPVSFLILYYLYDFFTYNFYL